MNLDHQDTQSDPITQDDPHNLDTSFKHLKFKNASSWSPIGAPNLEAMITCNERNLTKFIPKDPVSHNLTKQEKQALAELKIYGDITIKSADKGSAVVIMDTADYISEAIRQLSDKTIYKEIDTDLTKEHNNYVYALLKKMLDQGEIDEQCMNYLYLNKQRTSRFYMLLKIHKGITTPPGRPIVSANNSPT